MWKYLQSKSIGRIRPRKHVREKVCTPEQFERLMHAVEDSAKQFNKNWERDRALLYIAYNLGLRIGEVVLLEKKHFAKLEHEDVVALPTLKQKERIQHTCLSCGKRCRVSSDRIGDLYECPKCSNLNEVTSRHPISKFSIPLKDIPFIEGPVVAFIVDYISRLSPETSFLFPSRKADHISESFASRIFSTYAHLAGLSENISFHSLRHGRGMRLYSITDGDLIAVRDALRHKDIKTTQIYASMDADTINKYKKALEKGVYDPTKNRRGVNG